jgi:small subunit ribosomal protein S1
MLENADQVAEPQRGDLLEGYVLSVDSDGLIVDLGLKRDGIVPAADLDELPDDERVPSTGDTVAVMVVDPLDRDGNLIVSIAQARESGDWLEAHRLMEEDTIITRQPCGFNKGGLIVPFGRLRAFVPASHLSDLPRGLDEHGRAEYLSQAVERKLPFKVIEVDPRRRRLVLSERKAIRQWRQERKSQLIEELSEGEVRVGVVTSLREFGAFIDIGGADGLVHISELAWNRVEDPSSVLEVGQEIEVQVIRLDAKTNRIGLSLKRMQPSPWVQFEEVIQVDQEHSGTVSHLAASGVYVQLHEGPEGLLRTPDGPGRLTRGIEIRVRVVEFDPERERLELELVGDGRPTADPAVGELQV